MSRARVCLCVLCGLPAAGKSTLTHMISDQLHRQGYTTFIISYDELIPDHAFEFSTTGSENEESSKETLWKQHRLVVLACLEFFLKEPGTHANTEGSVCQRFKKAMEKQQIISALQNTHSESYRLAVLLDDNYYYQSMRYQVYQLARKYSVGFCQVYLQCPLEVCLHRNELRGQLVMGSVISEMSKRMEPPNTVKNSWEKNSVTLDSSHHVTDTHMQMLLQLISSSMENPLSPVQDDSEQRSLQQNSSFVERAEADRERCASSVVHQVDQCCRKLVSQAMITAREHKPCGAVLKDLARDLSQQKGQFLQELRVQVLHELGENECVCVEKVVNIATTTFKQRTDSMMETYGISSKSS